MEKPLNSLPRGKKSTVAHVIHSLARGGTETCMMQLIEQTQWEYNNIVLYREGENYWSNDLKRLGVKVIKLQGGTFSRLRYLVKNIRKNNVDIVYSYAYYNSAWVMLAAWFARIKKRLVHSHRIKTDNQHRKVEIFISKLLISLLSTDKLACSEAAGKSLFFGKNFIVIQNGIDVEKYKYNEKKRTQIRRKYAISDNCMVLGMVGWINHNKNQRFVIEVLKRLLSDGLDCKLLLVGKGDGKEDVELKKLCDEKKLTDKVIFAGTVNNVQDYYSAFDVAIVASKWESFSLVSIEAQANGVPLIVSNSVEEAIIKNDNAIIMDLDDGAEKWAQTIRKMAGKRTRPNEKINYYSTKKTVREIRRIYEK